MKPVLKIVFVALLLGASVSVSNAQQGLPTVPSAAPLTMKQVGRTQMSAADGALFDAAQARLARAAHVFGYRIQEPGWLCKEVLTNDTPDYLMLSCRQPRVPERGESAFTALVAREGNAVYVVPVMYGGAAPWKTAANMKVSREIFNHVVPERIAAEAIQPSGNWMELAMTFTALAGDESTVLAERSSNLKWLTAPEPTIVVKDGASDRTIIFSDVSPVGGVRIWNLTFNGQGCLLAAVVKVRPDLKPETVNAQSPQWRALKNLTFPAGKVTPVTTAQH